MGIDHYGRSTKFLLGVSQAPYNTASFDHTLNSGHHSDFVVLNARTTSFTEPGSAMDIPFLKTATLSHQSAYLIGTRSPISTS